MAAHPHHHQRSTPETIRGRRGMVAGVASSAAAGCPALWTSYQRRYAATSGPEVRPWKTTLRATVTTTPVRRGRRARERAVRTRARRVPAGRTADERRGRTPQSPAGEGYHHPIWVMWQPGGRATLAEHRRRSAESSAQNVRGRLHNLAGADRCVGRGRRSTSGRDASEASQSSCVFRPKRPIRRPSHTARRGHWTLGQSRAQSPS